MTQVAWPVPNLYIPHAPEPPQHAFLALPQLEAFYGGAAGGGKSDALLMAALQYVDVPGYAAILFRKTFSELLLENALLDRSFKWLGHTNARWNGDAMRWRFPSGASLTFGYMRNYKDRARYQSAEYQMVGYDELTAFEKGDYTFMFSRMRKPAPCDAHQEAKAVIRDDRLVCEVCGADAPPLSAVPLRMRSASNPGGDGHVWVKHRFIDLSDGTPRWVRPFIPAKIGDNPHIDQKGYIGSLSMLDPELQMQLLLGDWEAREPGEWVIPDKRWIDACIELGRKMWEEGMPDPSSHGLAAGTYDDRSLSFGIDFGEFTAAVVLWPLPEGGYYVLPGEVARQSTDPVLSTAAILEEGLSFGLPLGQARYDAAGVQTARTFTRIARRLPGLETLRSVGIAFGTYKRQALGYLRTLMRRTYAGEQVRVLAIHPDNELLIEQLRGWRKKETGAGAGEEIVKKDDHFPDALLAGIAPTARAYAAFIDRALRGAYQEAENNEVGVEEMQTLTQMALAAFERAR